MAKLTKDSLNELREAKKKEFRKCEYTCLVCGGTACQSNKGEEIYQDLIAEAKKQGVSDKIQVVKTGCFGFCEKGPIVKVIKGRRNCRIADYRLVFTAKIA
ncbi:hypothetical protein FACS1894102_1570 [Spirochaetia bacterium]|nr:hypothetical protein FACS1894102_1570 [Spirochaetia bacterium]